MTSDISYFWAEDSQPKTAIHRIDYTTAEAMFAEVFPNRSIASVLQTLKFKPGVEFDGRIKIYPSRSVQFEGTVNLGEKPQYAADAAFLGTTRQLYLARLKTTKDSTAIGWGLPLLRTMRSIAHDLGLKEILIRPGLADGGWIWARQGVVPDSKMGYDELRDGFVRPRLEQYKEQIVGKYEASQYTDILRLVQELELPGNLQKLASIKHIKVQTAEGPEGLGRAILRGTRWIGRMPLTPDSSETLPQPVRPQPVILENRPQRGLVKLISRFLPTARR